MNPNYPSTFDTAMLIKRLAPGAVILSCSHGQDIWTEVKLRKPCDCARCWQPIAKGAQAYRPLTFSYHRSDRICLKCIGQITRGEHRVP